MSARQQLGPNWLPHQFDYWRRHGEQAAGVSTTEILLLILDGVDNIYDLSAKSGLSASVTTGHVRRLRGLGLVLWTCLRGDRITTLCQVIDNSDYLPITLDY